MIRVALFTNIIQRTLSVFLSFLGFVSVTAFESHLDELNTLRAIVLFAVYIYSRHLMAKKINDDSNYLDISSPFYRLTFWRFPYCENFQDTVNFNLRRVLNRLPTTTWLVVYASGSKCQNTRNVSHRRYLNGAKFWRNRYVGKSNSDRVRSYELATGPALHFR